MLFNKFNKKNNQAKNNQTEDVKVKSKKITTNTNNMNDKNLLKKEYQNFEEVDNKCLEFEDKNFVKKNKTEKVKNTSKIKKIITITKFIVMLIILIGIPLYLFLFQKDFLESLKDTEKVIEFFETYKDESVFIYLVCQIVQIVICVIPGQIFQMAAGYLYGFFLGTIYSIIGAMLGTTITFLLARFLGKDALHLFFGEEKIESIVKKLNSRNAYLAVFFIFFIPGIPKDLACYAAGASEMKLKLFVIISVIGRTPAMCGSILFGVLYKSQNYTLMWIFGAFVILICIVSFLKRKTLLKFLDKFDDMK